MSLKLLLVLQIKQKNRMSYNNSMRYFLFCSYISVGIIFLSCNCPYNFASRSVSFKVVFHNYKMGIAFKFTTIEVPSISLWEYVRQLRYNNQIMKQTLLISDCFLAFYDFTCS